jgi:hypothetical protein
MIFDVLGLAGLVFIIVALVKGLQRPSRVANNGGNIPPVINDVEPSRSCWEKEPDFSPLARDRQEVLEIWEKCSNDPSFLPPIPPVKPTIYFGNETVSDVGGFDGETD